MHHDRNVSIEINNPEQLSRAELRVLWEGEVAGKAPPSLGVDASEIEPVSAQNSRSNV